jgi:hypothetical protein
MLDEGDAADLVDRFALQHRLPNGKTPWRTRTAPGHSESCRCYRSILKCDGDA